MAFPVFSLEILSKILEQMKDSPRPIRALSLGYPDILVNRETITRIFGEEIGKQVVYHPDSASIMRWHNIQDLTDGIPEADRFFKSLGIELDIVDIVKARGDEIIVDLNKPIADDLKDKYQLLIDAGTLEHCFNVAQAIKNLAEMVSVGGFILQSNPITCMNHGFYNFSPTFYYDFYSENGFDMVFFKGIVDTVRSPKTFDLAAYQRLRGIPEEANAILVVQKREQKNIEWPIQTKYKKNSHLKG